MRNIFLTSLLILCCVCSYAQRTIKGTVYDEQGVPLPGVSVHQLETSNATSTNVNGEFSLILDNGKKALLGVSMVGFLSQQVEANDQNVVITLVEEAFDLEQVVVVGYGTQKKASVTGAISTVNSEELVKTPVSSV